ncbi:MAG: sulfurtransferase TusA family protein [Gammaproteobacteria bacterium]
MSHYTLDARRLLCPLPVIRVQEQVGRLAKGDTLEVLCTDPGARHDIPAWCRVHGHRVVDVRTQGSEIVITVEVQGRE